MDILRQIIKRKPAEDMAEFSVKYDGLILVYSAKKHEAVNAMRKFYKINKDTLGKGEGVISTLSSNRFVLSGNYFDTQRILLTAVDKANPEMVCFVCNRADSVELWNAIFFSVIRQWMQNGFLIV